jgi:hypothetical protein
MSIAMGIGAIQAYADVENYRASVAEEYGTSQVVHFREHSGEPLYYNEPNGAYIYTGYVGYGMRDDDLEGLEILATGPAAKEAVDKYCELDNKAKALTGLTIIACMLAVSALVIMSWTSSNPYKHKGE